VSLEPEIATYGITWTTHFHLWQYLILPFEILKSYTKIKKKTKLKNTSFWWLIKAL